MPLLPQRFCQYFPMRKFTAPILLLSPTEGWSLPPCPGSWNNRTWTNCVGTYTYAGGEKYVGEFKNDNFNGQGTFAHPDGRVEEGIWKNDVFQYAKKAPSSRRARTRLAERRRKKEERLAREVKRKEARLRQREKEIEKKRRQSRTVRRTSPAAQDDWRSSGSGFYLKSTTHIMTNFHVIDKAKVIQVSFPKGGRYRGRVVAKNERNDLAVVKLLKMRPRRSGFRFPLRGAGTGRRGDSRSGLPARGKPEPLPEHGIGQSQRHEGDGR